jgi:hypothetical protein
MTIFLAVLLVSAGAARGQELRPYEPPPSRVPRIEQHQAPVKAAPPSVDEAVYERFRSDVQMMDPPTRRRLTDAIQKRLDRARQENRDEEARYNERLLGILGSIR